MCGLRNSEVIANQIFLLIPCFRKVLEESAKLISLGGIATLCTRVHMHVFRLNNKTWTAPDDHHLPESTPYQGCPANGAKVDSRN